MTNAEFDAIEARTRSRAVTPEELALIEAKPVRTEQERILLNALGKPVLSDWEYRQRCKRIAFEEGGAAAPIP